MMIDIPAIRAHFASLPDGIGKCEELNESFLGKWRGYQETLAQLVTTYFRERMSRMYAEFMEHPSILTYDEESKPLAAEIMAKHWPCDLVTFKDLMEFVPDEYMFHYMIYGMKMIEGARILTEHFVFNSSDPIESLKDIHQTLQENKDNVH